MMLLAFDVTSDGPANEIDPEPKNRRFPGCAERISWAQVLFGE